MHAAPPVRVSLGRSWTWIAFCAVCSGTAATNFAAWALLRAGNAAAIAWMAGALTAAAAAWTAARDSYAGTLNWDGAHWQWAGDEGDARVMLDLHAWMLLRFDPSTGRCRWIAATRQSCGGNWSALRAALYSPRPADPLDQQQP
jgi:hypothetical protein